MFLKLTIFTVCACIAFDEVHLKELNQRASAQFDNEVLAAHNDYRAKHGVPPLVLNATISEFSQSWAEHLSKQPNLFHSKNPNYGENIYWSGSTSSDYDVTGEAPVDSWYSEIANYTFNQEPTRKGIGHFTQLVWRNSKQIGVGKVRKDGKVWVVANYYPPGNYKRQYVANVPSPINES